MPKLDTTIDNLELKSNKVLGDVPSADWTDAQYPSAKTLYNTYNNLIDLMHPIGSILCVGENTNPANTLGGVWELVDKEFEFRNESLTSDILVNPEFTYGGTTYMLPRAFALYEKSDYSDLNSIEYSGHKISMSLVVELTDPENTPIPPEPVYNLYVGCIDYSRIGLSVTFLPEASSEIVTDLEGLYTAQCMHLDRYLIDSNTKLGLVVRGLVHNSVPLLIKHSFSVDFANMPDELCNKFYFKRIA